MPNKFCIGFWGHRHSTPHFTQQRDAIINLFVFDSRWPFSFLDIPQCSINFKYEQVLLLQPTKPPPVSSLTGDSKEPPFLVSPPPLGVFIISVFLFLAFGQPSAFE
jgi:hypothetical protein